MQTEVVQDQILQQLTRGTQCCSTTTPSRDLWNTQLFLASGEWGTTCISYLPSIRRVNKLLEVGASVPSVCYIKQLKEGLRTWWRWHMHSAATRYTSLPPCTTHSDLEGHNVAYEVFIFKERLRRRKFNWEVIRETLN